MRRKKLNWRIHCSADEATQVNEKNNTQEAALQWVMEAHLSTAVNYILLVDTQTHAYKIVTNDPTYEEKGILGRKIEKIVTAYDRLWTFLEIDKKTSVL